MDPSIYDKLATQLVSDTTLENFNTITKDTFIDKNNIDFWSGVITVARVLQESRTYAHGLPIPEASAMQTATIGDGASGTIKPTGTEVWEVMTVSLDNCIAFLTDGSGIMTLVLGGDNATHSGPLYLTNKLYIGFQNASGSEQTPGISYHKVGL